MAEKYNFHYTPTGTGVISGREVLTQTEDAINALGTYTVESRELIDGAVATAQEARATANSAASTAADASAAAQQAAQDAADVADSVAGFNDRLTVAENNASSALTTANSAKTTATQAKTTATQAKTAADAAQAAATQAQDSAAASATAAQASATDAGNSASLAQAWATSTTSPDGATDSDSPTGQTQSARTWALQAGSAAGDVAAAKTSAVRAINNAKTSAVNTVTGAGSAAVADVEDAQTEAIGAIGTAKNDALAEISSATDGFVTIATAQTVSGAKTFSVSPLVPTAAAGDSSTKAASTAFVQAAVAAGGGTSGAVTVTGDQTINGVKTFRSSPIVPTPSAGDSSTKAASTAFVADGFIPKTGARGDLAGWESGQTAGISISVNAESPDVIFCNYIGQATVTVPNGGANFWIKVVHFAHPPGTISLGSKWKWNGGVAPAITSVKILVLAWCGNPSDPPASEGDFYLGVATPIKTTSS